jgi:hypothetical protein
MCHSLKLKVTNKNQKQFKLKPKSWKNNSYSLICATEEIQNKPKRATKM